MTDVDNLRVEIDGDLGGLKAALDRAERLMDGATAEIKSQLERMDEASRKIWGKVGHYGSTAFSAWALGTQIIPGIVSRVREAGDKMGDLVDASERLGIGVEALQELSFAALDVGLSVGDLDGALDKLAIKAGQGDKIFERLGVSLRNTDGSLRSIGDIFDDVVSKAGALSSEQERLAVATDLFGKAAGPRMVLMLNQGADGVESLRARARELGLVLSETAVHGIDEAAKKLEIISYVIENQATKAFSDLMPVITDLANAVAWMLERLGQGYAVLRSYIVGLDGVPRLRQLREEQNSVLGELDTVDGYIADTQSTIDAVGPGGDPDNLMAQQLEGFQRQREDVIRRLNAINDEMLSIQRSLDLPPIDAPEQPTNNLPPPPGASRQVTGDPDAEVRRPAETEQTISGILREADALQAEADARGEGADAYAKWRREADLANKVAAYREKLIAALARSEGSVAVDVDAATASYERALRAADAAAQAMDDGPLQDLKQAFTDAGRDLASTLVDALQGADVDGGEILKRLSGRILELALQIQLIDPLLKSLGLGSGGSSGGTDIFGLISQGIGLISGLGGGSTYGPGNYNPSTGMLGHAAVGHPAPRPGNPIWVGEMGREIFVPDSPGRILSAQDLRGGGGRGDVRVTHAPTYNIDARGSQMSEAQFRAILEENNRQQAASLRRSFGGYARQYQNERG